MAHIQHRSPVHPDLYEAWVQRAQKAEAKIESDAKVIAALREALEELRVLGEQGAPPDYTRWLAFHDRVAEIARRGLATLEQTVGENK
jgi:hypothetical protein